MDQITSERMLISDAERARRRQAVNFSRTNVRLEGFALSPAVEELNRQFIAGQLSDEEHSKAIRHLYAA